MAVLQEGAPRGIVIVTSISIIIITSIITYDIIITIIYYYHDFYAFIIC